MNIRNTSSDFVDRFVAALVRDCFSLQTRNVDWKRSGNSHRDRLLFRIKDLVARCFQRFGLTLCRYDPDWLAFILADLNSFDAFFCLLADSNSRDVMVKVLEFRVLGPRHVKLPVNTEDFWEKYDTVDQKYARKLRTQPAWNGRWLFNRYEVPLKGQTVRLDAHPLTIMGTFLLEQYAYSRGGRAISVKEGDVVIDGGGCYGDTALYFAAKAGATGKVLSFEFVEESLSIFQKNLAMNQGLANRIRIVKKALWNHSGETLRFEPNGPGTRFSSRADAHDAGKVETARIDDLVVVEKLARVDFIKLDIEGAELQALQGALETITRFKPNLAVSLYHKKEDFVTIPQWIHALGLGYRFYLDHFTIHHEETVLFATVRD